MSIPGKKVSITWQARTTSNSAYGPSESWANADSFKAVLNAKSGRELAQYSKDTQVGDYILWCDYRNIQPKDRIKYGSRLFNVRFVHHMMTGVKQTKLELEEIEI